MASPFRSPAELQEVMERIFTEMSEHPTMGPALRAANVPQRFEFEDVDLVLNVRPGGPDEAQCLLWEWGSHVDWTAKAKVAMSSEVANKYFQGKLNIAMALARRQVKASGDIKAALALAPIIKPIHERYQAIVAVEYPHLGL